MTEQISKCPYCGSKDTKVSGWLGGSFGICNSCGTTGPDADNESDAIILWNVAANAKRADDATEIQHKLNAEIARLTAALADTEEQRHEAVSKLSLALIREVESNKRQDELEAEIEKLRKEIKSWLELSQAQLNEKYLTHDRS